MGDAPTLPLDSQLCFSIYSTSIAIQRAYKPMLDELGVTYTQYIVLSALWEIDGLTITAIADRLALEPSTITPAIRIRASHVATSVRVGGCAALRATIAAYDALMSPADAACVAVRALCVGDSSRLRP